MPNKTKPITPTNYMNVPIQPSGLPSWALTDEDLDKPKGIVEDIESLGMTTQTGIEPIQPTEFIFRDPSATTTLGPRLSAPFSPEHPGRSSPPRFASMSRQQELESEIARTNRLKRLREAEQQRLDMGMGWGSDSLPTQDKWLERQKKLDSTLDAAGTIIDETLDEVPGFVMSLDLPTPQTALAASSLWKSTQKKNLFNW